MVRFDRGGIRRGLVLVVVAAALMVHFPALAAVDHTGSTDAVFEGRLINIRESWQDASACLVWPGVLERPECFRTETEMNARIAELEKESGDVAPSLMPIEAPMGAEGSTCSGSLRLYDGTSYAGAVLYVRGRYQWFDLATYGFNQRTSSFKIGPCSSYFADLAAGGGAWYATSDTQAYDVAPTMNSGWDNDVSSIYIT